MSLLALLAIEHPILQAPMAGVSTPALAAAVSNAGGLGAIGVGNVDANAAAKQIAAFREQSAGSLNVNVFCHEPATSRPACEAAWIARLSPQFAAFDAAPPAALREIYRSFVEDDAMLAALVAARPKVVSFHFGIPSADRVRALREAGIVLLGSATSLAEAHRLVDGGVHAVVAQGDEAGGHRGVFDPAARDDRLGTMALVRILSRSLPVPIIAAGGIMDGAGITAGLCLGASAAQLGTAFVGCPESQADAGYRAALKSAAAHHTTMTSAISGRPARCLVNFFTALGADIPLNEIPDYPIAYDLGKALHAAARAKNESGYGAQWAGQGAPLSRSLPAAELMRTLVDELLT